MSYRAGIFEKREPTRQNLRNQKRDEFLKSQGFDILKATLDLDPDPQGQLDTMKNCLDKAKAGDPDSAGFLTGVSKELQIMNLGLSVFTTSKLGRPTAKSASWKTMRAFFGGSFKTW